MLKFENWISKLKIEISPHLSRYANCSKQFFEIWGKSHRKEREDPDQLNLDHYMWGTFPDSNVDNFIRILELDWIFITGWSQGLNKTKI